MFAKISRETHKLLLQHRQMSSAVYLWTETPRLTSKAGNIRERISMPKGEPKRVEAFD
jgi:hypothetical protein